MAATDAAPPAQQSALAPFPLLAAPGAYVAGTFDYYSNCSRDPARRVDFVAWLDVFRASTPTFTSHAARDASVPDAAAGAERFAQAFTAALDALAAAPTRELPGFSAQPVSCATLCHVRERCLQDAGFRDIFKAVKQTEDAAALQLLPQVLRALDAQPSRRDALEAALRGVFAGNIFDLGAAASAARYESGAGAGFHCALDALLPRPWVVDDLDALLARLTEGPRYAKAVAYVDNAGADVLLGMLPLARELVKAGTQVVLAANSAPSINDTTAEELRPLLAAAAAGDELLAAATASGALRVVASGNELPVVDLREVSAELAAEAADADLLILEGMGRAIETNLCATFTVDSIKLGMIKHPEVAACLGGRLYDCVCKFDAAGTTRSLESLTAHLN
ncbi:damage-control phosphatase [Scenedesmus sp. PABB004]|nr:damage-control phosphatase [Scenedesmus sp. PABB004]